MTTPLPSTVADRIRHARELVGVKAHVLSEYAELAQSHVGLIERGRVSEPKGDTLRALAAVLGCSVHWLRDGEGLAPTETEIRTAVDAARGRFESKRDKAANDAVEPDADAADAPANAATGS